MSTTTLVNTHLRLIAGYQMFGDMEGIEWANLVLGEAVKAGLIDSYTVADSHVGAYGIQYVRFTVDVPLSNDGSTPWGIDTDWRQHKIDALAFLNERLIGDSDVELHWLSPVQH